MKVFDTVFKQTNNRISTAYKDCSKKVTHLFDKRKNHTDESPGQRRIRLPERTDSRKKRWFSGRMSIFAGE